MFMRQLLVVSFSAALTFTCLGLSAFAIDDPKASANVSASADALDSSLAEKVEVLLRTDVGLAGSRFRVATSSSVVTVAGYVPDEHAMRRALDLVSGIRGVREVRNAMEIESPK